jgi:hypothetical protein
VVEERNHAASRCSQAIVKSVTNCNNEVRWFLALTIPL